MSCYHCENKRPVFDTRNCEGCAIREVAGMSRKTLALAQLDSFTWFDLVTRDRIKAAVRVLRPEWAP